MGSSDDVLDSVKASSKERRNWFYLALILSCLRLISARNLLKMVKVSRSFEDDYMFLLTKERSSK